MPSIKQAVFKFKCSTCSTESIRIIREIDGMYILPVAICAACSLIINVSFCCCDCKKEMDSNVYRCDTCSKMRSDFDFTGKKEG